MAGRGVRYGRGFKAPADKLPDASESEIKDACIQWLWVHGVFCWSNNTGQWTNRYFRKRDQKWVEKTIRYGKVGSGDIIGVLPGGMHIEIETKTSTNDQQEDQITHEQRVKEKGGYYFVARSIDDLERLVKPLLVAAIR